MKFSLIALLFASQAFAATDVLQGFKSAADENIRVLFQQSIGPACLTRSYPPADPPDYSKLQPIVVQFEDGVTSTVIPLSFSEGACTKSMMPTCRGSMTMLRRERKDDGSYGLVVETRRVNFSYSVRPIGPEKSSLIGPMTWIAPNGMNYDIKGIRKISAESFFTNTAPMAQCNLYQQSKTNPEIKELIHAQSLHDSQNHQPRPSLDEDGTR